METVRVDRPLGSFRELDRGEDIGALGLEVRAGTAVRLRGRVYIMLDTVEVDARAECVGGARDEDHARRVARGGGCQEFGCKELCEEEWSDVVGSPLALEAVRGEFERPQWCGCVVDEDLRERQAKA